MTEDIHVWNEDGWKVVGENEETPYALQITLKFCAVYGSGEHLYVFVFPKEGTRHAAQAHSALRWLEIPEGRWKEVFVGAGFVARGGSAYDSPSCKSDDLLGRRDVPEDPEEARRTARRIGDVATRRVFRKRVRA